MGVEFHNTQSLPNINTETYLTLRRAHSICQAHG